MSADDIVIWAIGGERGELEVSCGEKNQSQRKLDKNTVWVWELGKVKGEESRTG